MKIEIRFNTIPINAIEHDSTPFIQKSNGSGDIVRIFGQILLLYSTVNGVLSLKYSTVRFDQSDQYHSFWLGYDIMTYRWIMQ